MKIHSKYWRWISVLCLFLSVILRSWFGVGCPVIVVKSWKRFNVAPMCIDRLHWSQWLFAIALLGRVPIYINGVFLILMHTGMEHQPTCMALLMSHLWACVVFCCNSTLCGMLRWGQTVYLVFAPVSCSVINERADRQPGCILITRKDKER